MHRLWNGIALSRNQIVLRGNEIPFKGIQIAFKAFPNVMPEMSDKRLEMASGNHLHDKIPRTNFSKIIDDLFIGTTPSVSDLTTPPLTQYG